MSAVSSTPQRVHSVDPSRLLADLGRRIAELRVDRGLTQEGLAEKMRVTPRYVQSVESGVENLTMRTLAKFANALAIPIVSMFMVPQRPRPRPGRPKGGESSKRVSQKPRNLAGWTSASPGSGAADAFGARPPEPVRPHPRLPLSPA